MNHAMDKFPIEFSHDNPYLLQTLNNIDKLSFDLLILFRLFFFSSSSNMIQSYTIQKQGPRMKCSACKIIAHASCISVLMERSQLACKPTFRDVGVRQYREQTRTLHHWIHRRTEKGKCRQCGKVSKQLADSKCF
jgi:diacylglycerol kinase (ATP)